MLNESAFHQICNQNCTLCGRGPSSELTPTASAASLGHVCQQAVARDSRFARYCEGYVLADALFSRRQTMISYTVIFFTHLSIVLTAFKLITKLQFGFFGAVEVHEAFRLKDHFTGNPILELFNLVKHFRS